MEKCEVCGTEDAVIVLQIDPNGEYLNGPVEMCDTCYDEWRGAFYDDENEDDDWILSLDDEEDDD